MNNVEVDTGGNKIEFDISDVEKSSNGIELAGKDSQNTAAPSSYLNSPELFSKHSSYTTKKINQVYLETTNT